MAPVRIDPRIVGGVARELVAVLIAAGALEDVVGLRPRRVVDDGDAILQRDLIAGHADDALDHMLVGVEREVKDDDVVARDLAIGQKPAPDAGRREGHLVDE